MHWGNFGGMGFGGIGFGWIFQILFSIIVIVGVVYLIEYIVNTNKKEDRKETAEDILKKRYASGELRKEEFTERMKDLRAPQGISSAKT